MGFHLHYLAKKTIYCEKVTCSLTLDWSSLLSSAAQSGAEICTAVCRLRCLTRRLLFSYAKDFLY